MKQKIFITSIIALLFLIICLSFCTSLSSLSNKRTPNTIRVGYHLNFGGSSAIAIALRNGYFNDEELNVELVGFSSGPASLAALQANDIDISFMGHGAFGLVLQSNTKIFALDSLSYAEEIIARKDSHINSISDLYGKKIAVPFGTSAENFLRILFDINNLDYKQINVINMDILGCISALDKGYVDAVSVWAPISNDIYRKIGQDKVSSVAKCTDYKDQVYLPMYWVADADFLENNHTVITKFTRALLKALDWRIEHLEETTKYVGDLLDKNYEDLISDTESALWFSSPKIKEYLENSMIEYWFMTQYLFLQKSEYVTQNIDVSDIVDLTFLKEIL